MGGVIDSSSEWDIGELSSNSIIFTYTYNTLEKEMGPFSPSYGSNRIVSRKISYSQKNCYSLEKKKIKNYSYYAKLFQL